MTGATTTDALFGGKVVVTQPARGYRINVDALILAAFAARVLDGGLPRQPRRARHAFDLGSGVGAAGLSLIHFRGASQVTMIDIDPEACALAAENAEANGWSDRIAVVLGDARARARGFAGKADLVVCNPPYVAPGRGRPPQHGARSRQGDRATFLDATRIVLGHRGRACFVYPAIEVTDFLTALRERGLEPKRLRAVHGTATRPARVVLVECCAGRPGGLEVEPPFVETHGRSPTPSLAGLLDA